MLLNNYLRDEGYQLFEGDVYSGTMMEVADFWKYALENGYNPDTFGYIPLQERSNAVRTYNEEYFNRIREYPEAVEENYAKPAREALKDTGLEAVSFLADNTPFIGTAKGGYEYTNGRDTITGKELSEFSRAITGVSLGFSFFPFGRYIVQDGAKLIKKVDGIIEDVADVVKSTSKNESNLIKKADEIADVGEAVPTNPQKGGGLTVKFMVCLLLFNPE
ncbi:hypothetical protein EJP82_11190 [Paenibacillus anaericanus]|uniref:Pre-toxin TG domain-containing protein n=1 Tax=Paenibacillus anaericanus TaxID=170367 RepID=A0A433YA75_9BACL|nr:pre-toxin TG domain-containing protein [Paenibacillus anaericanus]RUT46785.1 hypothetical protein EJP82_11190 [Paenibacillus anaericanus]